MPNLIQEPIPSNSCQDWIFWRKIGRLNGSRPGVRASPAPKERPLPPRGASWLGRSRGHPRLEVCQGGRPANSGWGRNRNRKIGRIREEIYPSSDRLGDWLVSFPLLCRTRAVSPKPWKRLSKVPPSCWTLAVVVRALPAKSAHRSTADPEVVANNVLRARNILLQDANSSDWQ